MSYKKQEHLSSPPVFLRFVLLIFLVCCVVLLCIITFSDPCCDVRYDFRLKTMLGSSLPPVVCRIYVICVCLRQHILCCVFVWFFFILCSLCYQFLCIVIFLLPLRYSLTFILDIFSPLKAEMKIVSSTNNFHIILFLLFLNI